MRGYLVASLMAAIVGSTICTVATAHEGWFVRVCPAKTEAIWRSPAADKGSAGPGLRAEHQTKPISLAAFVPWRGSIFAAVRPQRQAIYNLTPMSVSGSAIISSSVWNSTITRITRKAGMIRTIARVNAA
jgi:hypothetical protein